MMKKNFFVFSMLMFMVLTLISCENHTHQASEEWKTDATSHWHICSGCDELLDIAVHTFDDWQVSVQATVSQVGSEKRTCTVCGYEETREIPKVSHEHSYATTYSSNSTHHWYACECGEKKDEAVHTGGTATTESLAVCEVCGKEYGDLLPQPSHVCSYVEGVCSCGKTEPGAFDKTIDGSFDDWSEEDKANALTTFGESGTGFSVMGYYKDDKAYFATTISTAVVDPHSFEIFQKDGQTRYMVKYSGNGGSWTPTEGAEHLIGLSVTQEKDDKGNNVYYVETLWDFSEFPREANGNYKINFSVVLYFPELSAASYSDVQQDYWVLYGRNAWDRSWHFELTDTTKFTHSHVYNKNFECVICGADNKLADSEIDLDGKIDDWNENILDKMLVSYDEEDRWFKLVGYTDEKYLYLYLSLAHREAVGAVNIVILGDDGWIEYGQIKYGDSISLRGIDAAHVIEYKDDETSFIVTDYEFAISLDKIRTVASRAVTDKGVQLGIDIFNESDEQSYGFAIDNKLFMWGIAGLSSWNVNQHFIYGNNGVDHQHTWDEETLKCKLCPADMPEVEGDIVVDGDLSDWSAEIKATTSKTYGESGTGWEIMGYREGTIVYFGVTIKTAGAVPALFSFVERGSLGFTDHQIRYENGEWKKTAGVLYIGSSFEDSDIIDTYVLEVVCDLSELEAYEDGDYLFGLNVNVPGEASAATFEAAKPDYWVMFGRNAWEADDKLFRITESGITHKHIFDSEYEYDDVTHSSQCLCGYIISEPHKGGTATADKLAICVECGQPYGDYDNSYYGQVTINDMYVYANGYDGITIRPVLSKPENNLNEVFQYTVENDSICYIEDGKIYFKSIGETLVTAKSEHFETTFTVIAKNFKFESQANSLLNNLGTSFKGNETLFIGDSFFQFWRDGQNGIERFYKSFLGYETINIGMSGSTVHQWRGVNQKLFNVSGAPKNIIINLGTNNINVNGEDGYVVSDNLKVLLQDYLEMYPNTNIYIFSVTRCFGILGSNWKYANLSNEIIEEFCATNDRLHYLDAMEIFGDDFVNYLHTDGLHMNQNGYNVFKQLILETVPLEEKESQDDNPKEFSITLDGKTSDWSEEQKANVLKGWYVDSQGRTRGLEYMAFIDENYVYLYTRTITASNADKGLDIIFNKDSNRLATSMWMNASGENVVDYYFAPNVALENGLYETVYEIVLAKNSYVNSNGKVFLGVWFIGCDDSYAELSWHESGKTSIWGLNHRCPWNLTMSHQQVTKNGFDHYHDLDANNVCGWCQETIELGITVDGNKDDWSEEVLATALTSAGKNNIYAAAYLDDEFAYFYVEITQLGSQEPNYFRIFAKDSQKDGIRSSEDFPLYFDAGTTAVRPWCLGGWTCAHYNDCDNGYTKYALSKTTNADGQTVFAYELVIDRDLICKPNGDVQVQITIDDINVWASGQTVADWSNMPYVTKNGFSN